MAAQIALKSTFDIPDITISTSDVHGSCLDYPDVINKNKLWPQYGAFYDCYIRHCLGTDRDETSLRIINSNINFFFSKDMSCVDIMGLFTIHGIYGELSKIGLAIKKSLEKIGVKTVHSILKMAVRLLIDCKINKLTSNISEKFIDDNIEEYELVYYWALTCMQVPIEIRKISIEPHKPTTSQMARSYYKYCTSEVLCDIVDVWNIALLHSTVHGPGIIFNHPNLNLITTLDYHLDIYNYVEIFEKDSLMINPSIGNSQISAYADLIFDDVILDIKCSKREKSMSTRCLRQLLIYAALYLEKYGKKINTLMSYNPLFGFVSTVDISKWNGENELLEELYPTIEKGQHVRKMARYKII